MEALIGALSALLNKDYRDFGNVAVSQLQDLKRE